MSERRPMYFLTPATTICDSQPHGQARPAGKYGGDVHIEDSEIRLKSDCEGL